MAAPLNPTSFDSFDLRPLAPARPHLRVIEGGRSETVLARRRVYRRRRIVVAVLACAALALGVRLAGVAAGAITGDGATVLTAAATPDAAGAGAGAGSAEAAVAPAADPAPVYVVRRGDTLWSIAATLGADAGSDPRELVDALSERTDGRALQPGQRIDVSGLPGLDA